MEWDGIPQDAIEKVGEIVDAVTGASGSNTKYLTNIFLLILLIFFVFI